MFSETKFAHAMKRRLCRGRDGFPGLRLSLPHCDGWHLTRNHRATGIILRRRCPMTTPQPEATLSPLRKSPRYSKCKPSSVINLTRRRSVRYGTRSHSGHQIAAWSPIQAVNVSDGWRLWRRRVMKYSDTARWNPETRVSGLPVKLHLTSPIAGAQRIHLSNRG